MKSPKLAYAVWSWGLGEKSELETALRDVREAGFSYFESVLKTVRIFDNDAGEFMKVVNREKVSPVSFYFTLSGDYDADLKTVEGTLEFLGKTGVTRASIQAPGKKGGGATPGELEACARACDGITDLMTAAGITPCLHPHTNTQVMYEKEIDHLMARSRIAFGPDTAHLAAAGCDPVEMFRRYAERIRFVHLKDVKKNRELRIDVSRDEAFEIYSDFLELGAGDVDLDGVFDVLGGAGYEGWLTVELDRAPSSQRESAFRNMEYLRRNFLPRYRDQ